MIQQYIKGKSLEELLESIKYMNVDDFFDKIYSDDLVFIIPKIVLNEKKEQNKTNRYIETLIKENNFEQLPRNEKGVCFFNGNLNLKECRLKILPDNLTVNGDLECYNNHLTSLPDNLIVNRDLYCYNNRLTTLPVNLNVGGYLHCRDNNLTSLPDILKVGGSLNCSFNNLISLPDNLTVNDNLNCSYNYLTKLPKNLRVNGNFECYKQKNGIRLELPKSAIVTANFIN